MREIRGRKPSGVRIVILIFVKGVGAGSRPLTFEGCHAIIWVAYSKTLEAEAFHRRR
jgi:hypothetical protein